MYFMKQFADRYLKGAVHLIDRNLQHSDLRTCLDSKFDYSEFRNSFQNFRGNAKQQHTSLHVSPPSKIPADADIPSNCNLPSYSLLLNVAFIRAMTAFLSQYKIDFSVWEIR